MVSELVASFISLEGFNSSLQKMKKVNSVRPENHKNLCGNLSVEILDKDTNVHESERLTIVSKMKTKIYPCFRKKDSD